MKMKNKTHEGIDRGQQKIINQLMIWVSCLSFSLRLENHLDFSFFLKIVHISFLSFFFCANNDTHIIILWEWESRWRLNHCHTHWRCCYCIFFLFSFFVSSFHFFSFLVVLLLLLLFYSVFNALVMLLLLSFFLHK